MGLLGSFGMFSLAISFRFWVAICFLILRSFLCSFACEVDDGNLKDLMASRVVIPTQY
jgi:hypothetical protein